MILGIDEVGRGPWAGPLVVGAVVLGGAAIEGLTDSKKLTKKRREVLEVEILEKAAGWGLGWVSATELDEIGLGTALRLATRRAVEQVKTPYHEIIIDGTINFLSDTSKGQYVTTMPKADLLVPSVSAASIIAKVARDRYMAEQDDIYPGYGFAGHAGYGVAKHRAAIEQLGVTPLHRLSFAPLQKYANAAADAILPGAAHSRQIENDAASLQSAELAALKQSSTGQEATLLSNGLTRAPGKTASVPTTTIGNAAETEVANYLVRHGHEIIERNWKTKYCEIDIVSEKKGTLYFTEVKYRKTARHGDGLAAITQKKQNQMAFAARLFATQHKSRHELLLAAASVTGEPPVIEEFIELR